LGKWKFGGKRWNFLPQKFKKNYKSAIFFLVFANRYIDPWAMRWKRRTLLFGNFGMLAYEI